NQHQEVFIFPILFDEETERQREREGAEAASPVSHSPSRPSIPSRVPVVRRGTSSLSPLSIGGVESVGTGLSQRKGAAPALCIPLDGTLRACIRRRVSPCDGNTGYIEHNLHLLVERPRWAQGS
ncbi:hypothetical protein KIPB_016368, partial [Kipferlia bialata]